MRQEAGEAVLWVPGKGRQAKDAFVILTSEALEPVREYLASRGALSDDAPLFCSHSDRNAGEALTTRSISTTSTGSKMARSGIFDSDSKLTYWYASKEV